MWTLSLVIYHLSHFSFKTAVFCLKMNFVISVSDSFRLRAKAFHNFWVRVFFLPRFPLSATMNLDRSYTGAAGKISDLWPSNCLLKIDNEGDKKRARSLSYHFQVFTPLTKMADISTVCRSASRTDFGNIVLLRFKNFLSDSRLFVTSLTLYFFVLYI